MTTSAYSRNIHSADSSYGLSVLKDNNDWGNLYLPFSRGFVGQTGASASLKIQPVRVNPMNERPNIIVAEDAPTAEFFNVLRELSNAPR